MKQNHGAQYELSIDSVPHSYRDRHDIALPRQGNHNRKSPAWSAGGFRLPPV
jgi:hypothetical protein